MFAQTYGNWELLLVDDGSTDSSTKIAQRYTEQYPGKVRYLEHEGHCNRGKSAARNLGIYHAKGEYIAFLDADDIWLPPKLEHQVAILEAQPNAAMVYGSTQVWYSWTGNPKDIQLDYQRRLGIQPNTLIKPPALLTLFLQGEAEPPGTCGVLVRRKVIEEVGGFEEAVRDMYEDQAFFAKVCLKATVFVESGCWDRYRQHLESCCSIANDKGQYHHELPHPAHRTFLNWLTEYLSEQGIKDVQVWKALQKALWPYRYPVLYYLLRPRHLVMLAKHLLKLIGRRTFPVRGRRRPHGFARG